MTYNSWNWRINSFSKIHALVFASYDPTSLHINEKLSWYIQSFRIIIGRIMRRWIISQLKFITILTLRFLTSTVKLTKSLYLLLYPYTCQQVHFYCIEVDIQRSSNSGIYYIYLPQDFRFWQYAPILIISDQKKVYIFIIALRVLIKFTFENWLVFFGPLCCSGVAIFPLQLIGTIGLITDCVALTVGWQQLGYINEIHVGYLTLIINEFVFFK